MISDLDFSKIDCQEMYKELFQAWCSAGFKTGLAFVSDSKLEMSNNSVILGPIASTNDNYQQ